MVYYKRSMKLTKYNSYKATNYQLSESLYHATLGGAKALDLDDKLGNFNAGKEADFVVLNIKPTALQQLRRPKR